MNLAKLFETQRVLDARIEKEHPRVEGEDRLAKKILALQVELGECANEWRGFKFWSTRQSPNNETFTSCKDDEAEYFFCGVCHEEFSSSYAKTNEYQCLKDLNHLIGMKNANQLLEEYVDCLHFILSIGLELGTEYFNYNQDHIFKESDITVQFLRVIDYTIGLREDDYCSELLQSFIHLGEMLGFTWEQIEQAYYEKNEINHARQEAGY